MDRRPARGGAGISGGTLRGAPVQIRRVQRMRRRVQQVQPQLPHRYARGQARAAEPQTIKKPAAIPSGRFFLFPVSVTGARQAA